MRLVSFNMRHGGSREHWSALIEATAPDLIFAQETLRPCALEPALVEGCSGSHAPWAPANDGRWGSAVFHAGGGLRPMTLESLSGWVVGTVWASPLGTVCVWSVHLPPVRGSYLNAAHEVLDLLAPSLPEMPMILAGDWNVTVGVRHPDEEMENKKGEVELLERLESEFDVRSAWSVANPGMHLPQTLRWARDPKPPYHCDGIFLPSAWCERIVRAEVLSGSPWTELSDHNPLLVELSVG